MISDGLHNEDMWSRVEAADIAEELLSLQSARWNHVCAAAWLAEDLAGRGLTSEAVVSAAWLHDVGYAPRLEQTGMHAIDGARYLAEIGAPPTIVSLVAFHTGAEYEAAERGLAAELNAFDRPQQSELDVLTFVDLVSDPDGNPVAADERIAEILDRYGPEHPVHRSVRRAEVYLRECVQRVAAAVDQPM